MFRAEGARQILGDSGQNVLQIYYSKTRAEGAPKMWGVWTPSHNAFHPGKHWEFFCPSHHFI